MNPLGVSVIFVICSILLSFLKHFFFNSPKTSSTMKFNKVFQLTNNKTNAPNKHFKSLYQAYHKHEILDTERYTSMLPNRSLFNPNVLIQSFRNQELSLLCGSNYLVTILGGIDASSDNIQWANVIQVYKLPLLNKLHQFRIVGKVLTSQKCKQNVLHSQKTYTITFVNRAEFSQLKISQSQATLTPIKQRWRNDQLAVSKFEYGQSTIAYWSEQMPWIIHVESLQKSRQFEKPRTINLIHQKQQRETNISDALYKVSHKIAVHYLFLFQFKNKQSINLAVVYESYLLKQQKKQMLLSTYEIYQGTIVEINTSIIYRDEAKATVFSLDCQTDIDRQSKVSISCIRETFTNGANFIKIYDIFEVQPPSVLSPHSNNISQQNVDDQQSYQVDQTDQQFDYLDDFVDYLIPSAQNNDETENAPQKAKLKKIKFTFDDMPLWQKRIIKSSHSNPIVYYKTGQDHCFFAFSISDDLNIKKPLSTSLYAFEAPVSDKKQERYLRAIQWIDEQNLIIVVWGSSIDVFEYSFTDFPQDNGSGIAMSVMLPFIELFATVFCFLRLIWTSD